MKNRWIVSVLIAALLIAGSIGFAATSHAPEAMASDAQWTLLELFNDYRAQKGLQPLSMLPQLQTAAGARASELGIKESESRPNGSHWITVLSDVRYACVAASQSYMKNLNDPSTAPYMIVNTITASQDPSVLPFRSALLTESYTHIGIGSANGYYVWIFTSGGCELEDCTVSSQTGAIYTKGANIDSLAMVAAVRCEHGTSHFPVSDELCKVIGSSAELPINTKAGESVSLPKKPDAPVSIALSHSEITMNKGDVHALTAVLSPVSSASTPVVWTSSDSSIASVKDGVVTALRAGEVTISASAGEVSAACKVTVVDEADSIACNIKELTLGCGQQYQASYTVSPLDCSEKGVWSVYPANAAVQVDENGLITAGNATGKAYVIVSTPSGKTDRIRVTIVEAKRAVQSMRISAAQASVTPGGSIRLATKVYPSNALNRKINWVSSNPTVASVDQNGIVYGLQKGQATIYAVSSSGVHASCEVTVQDVQITAIAFKKDQASVLVGKECKVTPAILPKSASVASLVWTSSDPSVAQVDQSGKITTLKKGTTVITASASEQVSASITLNVTDKPVTAIRISKKAASVTVGTSGTIRAQVYPANATNTNVIWSSSDPSVVSVDANGRISALSSGTAVITAASESYPNVKAACTITVYSNQYKRTLAAYTEGKASAWVTAVYMKDDTLRVQVCYYNPKPYAVKASVFGDEVLLNTSSATVFRRLPISEKNLPETDIAARTAVHVIYEFSVRDYPELSSLNLRALHSNSRVG